MKMKSVYKNKNIFISKFWEYGIKGKTIDIFEKYLDFMILDVIFLWNRAALKGKKRNSKQYLKN